MSYLRLERLSPLAVGAVCIAVALSLAAILLQQAWLLAVIALVGTLLAAGLYSAAPRARARRRAATTLRPQMREALSITRADGSQVAAQLVPLPQEHEWRLALTRDGYALVDHEGRVRHALKSS